MTDAERDEYSEIAQDILGKAISELMGHGVDYLQACHDLIKMGLDSLPGGACPVCLRDHYELVLDAVEDRIKEIPTLRPGVDCAVGCCVH